MKSKAYKGGDFEREVCKLLSKWWSKGLGMEERDDIFWRTSQSGGRATQRRKLGMSTFGSYGDIAAVDPIGEPLLKFVTLELKRGSSHGTPWDLFESAPSKAIRPFEAALAQAKTSSEQAGSMGWALIARRDRKEAMIYLDRELGRLLGPHICSYVMFRIGVNPGSTIRFTAHRLEDFLYKVTPQKIIECLK